MTNNKKFLVASIALALAPAFASADSYWDRNTGNNRQSSQCNCGPGSSNNVADEFKVGVGIVDYGITAATNFTTSYTYNDNLGFRTDLSYGEGTNHSLNSVRALGLIGNDMASEGFYQYLSAGIHYDRWDIDVMDDNETISGWTAGGGIGYNFNEVSIDLWINYHDKDKYEDDLVINPNHLVTGIGISQRL